MISKIKYATTTALLSLLSACGGGGGGGSASAPAPVVQDPKIMVYSTFDLANSVLSGISASAGVLQSCGLTSPATATQINLMKYSYDPYVQKNTKFNFILDGSFNLPNVTSCSTTGVTGVITGVTLMRDNNPAYMLTGLAIDAGSFKYGQQFFWSTVLKQTGKIINSQTTSSQIECVDSAGKGWYTPLTTVGDISNFFATCAK